MSNIPTAIQPLIADALNKVRKHPEHWLEQDTRLAIYKTFGNPCKVESIFSDGVEILVTRHNLAARYFFAWLKVITVKKLLPELEKLETYESDWSAFDPVKTIELAENVLAGKIEPDSIYRQAAKYMDYAFATHVEDDVNERGYYLNTLPTYALEEVLFWDQQYRNTLLSKALLTKLCTKTGFSSLMTIISKSTS
jgi:hypothetical protein